MEVVIVGFLVGVLIFVLIRNSISGTCRRCGKRTRRGAQVCPYCGNSFTTPDAETPAEPEA